MSSASSLTSGARHPGDPALYRGKVGMVCLFVSEAHMFGVLIIAYLAYLDQSLHSETPPSGVLKLPLAVALTVCLVGSSGTITLAGSALRRGAAGAFRLWWIATIALGLLFLAGTGYDWSDLIGHHGLSLGRNLFGTTYFTLIGLHATHVTIGAAAMLVVLGLALAGKVSAQQPAATELLTWYWHFVDGVWVVIFCVVYLYGR